MSGPDNPETGPAQGSAVHNLASLKGIDLERASRCRSCLNMQKANWAAIYSLCVSPLETSESGKLQNRDLPASLYYAMAEQATACPCEYMALPDAGEDHDDALALLEGWVRLVYMCQHLKLLFHGRGCIGLQQSTACAIYHGSMTLHLQVNRSF